MTAENIRAQLEARGYKVAKQHWLDAEKGIWRGERRTGNLLWRTGFHSGNTAMFFPRGWTAHVSVQGHPREWRSPICDTLLEAERAARGAMWRELKAEARRAQRLLDRALGAKPVRCTYQVYKVSAAGKEPVFETWRNQKPFTNRRRAEQFVRHWNRTAAAAGSEVSYVLEAQQ